MVLFAATICKIIEMINNIIARLAKIIKIGFVITSLIFNIFYGIVPQSDRQPLLSFSTCVGDIPSPQAIEILP